MTGLGQVLWVRGEQPRGIGSNTRANRSRQSRNVRAREEARAAASCSGSRGTGSTGASSSSTGGFDRCVSCRTTRIQEEGASAEAEEDGWGVQAAGAPATRQGAPPVEGPGGTGVAATGPCAREHCVKQRKP